MVLEPLVLDKGPVLQLNIPCVYNAPPEIDDGDGNQSGTYDPGWRGGVLVSANFERLVLGCIEAKFCK